MNAPESAPQLEAGPDKQLATCRARTALWGGTLMSIEDDRGQPLFIVSRWALTRSFADLGEVEDFLRKVGA